MPVGLIIGLSSSSLIFFVLFLIFSITNYKKRFDSKYDLRNHFPYELNYKSSFGDNVLGNISLITSMVLAMSSFGVASVKVSSYTLLLAPIIAGSLYSLIIIFVPFADIKYLRFHVILDVLLSGCAFLTPASLGLIGLSIFQTKELVAGLVYLIIGLIVGLFNFVLIMNPKFSFNINMKVVKLADGTEQYQRPKLITMALSEWLMILTTYISHILLILILFLL